VKRGNIMDTKIILEDILVRAVDLQPERQQDKPGSAPATVTLEVTPEDALVLTRALEAGSIRLALRPTLDNGKKSEQKPELVVAEPAPAPPAPAPELPKPKPAQVSSLKIFNGNRVLSVNHVTQDGQTTTEYGKGLDLPQLPAVSPEPATRPAEKITTPAGQRTAPRGG
jgi:hypothetical protein